MLGKLFILLVIVGFVALINGKAHLQINNSLVPRGQEACASRSQADLILKEVDSIKLFLNYECKVTPRSCPPGWTEYNSSCYMIIDRITKKFQDARKACQDLGGYLVKISSAGENTFVFELAIKASKQGFLWIGFFKGADQTFHWLDGTLLSGGYTKWVKSEPNNFKGHEFCGEMYLKKDAPGWNDIACVSPRNVVIACEKQK